MSSLILNEKLLYNVTASATGESFALDWRFKPSEQVRSITCRKVANDVITIQTAITATDWYESVVFGSTVTEASALIAGAWKFIRAVKTGENGTTTVRGLI